MELENPAVAQAICRIRRLKTLVKSARACEPTTPLPISIRKTSRFKVWQAAASVMLAIVAIFILALPVKHTEYMRYVAISTYPDSQSLLTAARAQQNLKLVLHLKSADVEASNHIISILQSVLSTSPQYSQQWKIEVIACCGPGIHLLLDEDTAYARQIRALRLQHSNIKFLACRTTVQSL